MFREYERFFKRIIKGKQSYTKMLLITFLMTGILGLAVPITPNTNGEYIVNSTTGDGEIYNPSPTLNGTKIRISDGKKLTLVDATSGSLSSSDPIIVLSDSNTQFEATGTPINTNSSVTFVYGPKESIIYSITNPLTGVSSSANNQKINLKDMGIIQNGYRTANSLIKVEAKNGYSIKGAELNLEGTADHSAILEKLYGWVIEVEGDASTNTYSELTVNTKGDSSTDTFNATIHGLMYKEGKSILNVNLNEDSIWEFDVNPNLTQQRSTVNNLTINKGGYIDVSAPTESDGETALYYLKLTSDGINKDGLLTNGGVITFVDGDLSIKDVFTVEGNYHGNNGEIYMDTMWNNPGDENGGNSYSDLLYITGNATGSTKIIPYNIDNTTQDIIPNQMMGNVQQLSKRINSVPVVKVAGTSTATAFTGTAKTISAGEAQLTSRQVNGVWEYYWTIAPINSGGSTGVINGSGSGSGTGSGNSAPIYIYAQPVTAYTLMPKVNMEMGYASLGTLHERKSENQILNWENILEKNNQIWTRVYGKGLNEKGKNRFEYESNLWGVQVGDEFKINEDEKGNIHLLGGYISYNKTNIDFFDKYRTVNGIISNDKYTGEGKSESISLGLTKTKYTSTGAYYDLVGQISFLQNKYKSRDDYNVENKGYGLILSAEVGKPFIFVKDKMKNSEWAFEPQGQLIYQHLNTKSFNDGLRNVNQENINGLRGRVGFRLSNNSESKNEENRKNSYYLVGNIWHDFIKNENKGAVIGLDKINEKYGTTWGEIGIGAQAPVGKQGNLYIDTRYEHSFNNSNRNGYRGTIGYKYSF